MPVSQSRLLICLIASSLLSTTGFADSVIVNTTVDENKIDNQSCSLREAVSYLNAKNAKKRINDEEVAIISGTSAVLSLSLITALQDVAIEQAKETPDNAKITQLTNTINELTIKVNAGLVGLNQKLDATNDALDQEESKTIPDATVIATHKATIIELKTAITNQQEAKTVKLKELADFRTQGLFGCVSTSDAGSDSDVATLLPLPTAYLLNTPITINLGITVTTNAATTADDGTIRPLEDNTLLLPLRPIIKANANNTLFIIDDSVDNDATTTTKPIAVAFNNIDFIGCDQLCAVTDGGIFLNKENLSIANSVISKGQASYGGAIYNAALASLVIKKGILKENQALDGAAIFSELNSVSLENTLITQNKATTPNNGIVTIKSDVSNFASSLTIPHVDNSTFSGNEGTAISSYGDILFNNNTIVKNTIGMNLNHKLPLVYNSIIAGNSQADCNSFATPPDDGNIYFANNLSVQNKGCPTVSAKYNNLTITDTGSETLIADANNDGICDAPPAVGLLCPLGEFGGLTKTHKPRLLASYTKLSESPIVNKGFYEIIGNSGVSCNNTDQRGFVRENNENRCDIGAVEIQTGLLSYTQGDDIVFGQIKRFSPLANLADAELLPASYCASVLGAGDYLNGCIKLTDFPKHGIVQFDPLNADILYSTTNPDFHGFDKFSYSIVTTLSRFSDAINDRTLTTNVKVVSEPSGSASSKALDSGSMNIFSLLILSSFFAVWRRARRG